MDVKRVVADAIEEARDGALDREHLERVRNLLLTSEEARKYFLEQNALSHGLTFDVVEVGGAEQSYDPVATDDGKRNSHRRFGLMHRHRRTLVAIAVLLLLSTFYLIVEFSEKETAEKQPVVVASLERMSGRVSLITRDAKVRVVESTIKIEPGDTVRTQSSLSSAVLRYPDGTRLSLVGRASLTVVGRESKSVVLHGGTVFASVASQPDDRPMRLTTPRDTLHVPGTKFSLAASADATDLSVLEGHLRLTRLRDGKSVEVPEGQNVISDIATELSLRKSPGAPDFWRADFEAGIPTGWERGTFVSNHLPEGARGGVRAQLGSDDDGGKSYAIVSNDHWHRGMFSVHRDSHLRIVFKMQAQRWVNIFLITRTRDSDSPKFANNFLFDKFPFHKVKPDRWYSITIPLSEFKRLPGHTNLTLAELLPFQLVIHSDEPDRGLVIDRIEVTKGGSGVVELALVE